MANFDLHTVMQHLAQRRPVLRPRGDFDQSLAVEIQRRYPEASVQQIAPLGGRWEVLDVMLGSERICVKPRYHTAELHCTVNGETFELKKQAAQNLEQYDVLRDLMRLEQLVQQGEFAHGYVILLTNDARFWQPPVRTYTRDANFRQHEGRVLEGTLRWSEQTGAGTMKGREEPIVLKGSYLCQWRHYFSLTPPRRNGEFRYLLLQV
jgi:hypothetical protein